MDSSQNMGSTVPRPAGLAGTGSSAANTHRCRASGASACCPAYNHDVDFVSAVQCRARNQTSPHDHDHFWLRDAKPGRHGNISLVCTENVYVHSFMSVWSASTSARERHRGRVGIRMHMREERKQAIHQCTHQIKLFMLIIYNINGPDTDA